MGARLQKLRSEKGFTLIELLIVIVILGILAAVVIFAVSGITDRGEEAACKADKKTLQTAEEANYAQNGSYVSEADLVTNGFLQAQSELYNVTLGTGGASYSLTVQDTQCTGI